MVNTSKEKDESEQHSISHKHKLSIGSIKPIGKEDNKASRNSTQSSFKAKGYTKLLQLGSPSKSLDSSYGKLKIPDIEKLTKKTKMKGSSPISKVSLSHSDVKVIPISANKCEAILDSSVKSHVAVKDTCNNELCGDSTESITSKGDFEKSEPGNHDAKDVSPCSSAPLKAMKITTGKLDSAKFVNKFRSAFKKIQPGQIIEKDKVSNTVSACSQELIPKDSAPEPLEFEADIRIPRTTEVSSKRRKKEKKKKRKLLCNEVESDNYVPSKKLKYHKCTLPLIETGHSTNLLTSSPELKVQLINVLHDSEVTSNGCITPDNDETRPSMAMENSHPSIHSTSGDSMITMEGPKTLPKKIKGLKRTARKTINKNHNHASEMALVKDFVNSHNITENTDSISASSDIHSHQHNASPLSGSSQLLQNSKSSYFGSQQHIEKKKEDLVLVDEQTKSLSKSALASSTVLALVSTGASSENLEKTKSSQNSESSLPYQSLSSTELSSITKLKKLPTEDNHIKLDDPVEISENVAAPNTTVSKDIDESLLNARPQVKKSSSSLFPKSDGSRDINKSVFESVDLDNMLSAAGYKESHSNATGDVGNLFSRDSHEEVKPSVNKDLTKCQNMAKWTTSITAHKLNRKNCSVAGNSAEESCQRKPNLSTESQESLSSEPGLVIDTQVSSPDVSLTESLFSPDAYEAPPSVQVVGPIIEAPPSVLPASDTDGTSEGKEGTDTASKTDDITINDENYVPHSSNKGVGYYKFSNGVRVVTVYRDGELYCSAHQVVIRLKLSLTNLSQLKCSSKEASLIRMMDKCLKENFDSKVVPLSEVQHLLSAQEPTSKALKDGSVQPVATSKSSSKPLPSVSSTLTSADATTTLLSSSVTPKSKAIHGVNNSLSLSPLQTSTPKADYVDLCTAHTIAPVCTEQQYYATQVVPFQMASVSYTPSTLHPVTQLGKDISNDGANSNDALRKALSSDTAADQSITRSARAAEPNSSSRVNQALPHPTPSNNDVESLLANKETAQIECQEIEEESHFSGYQKTERILETIQPSPTISVQHTKKLLSDNQVYTGKLFARTSRYKANSSFLVKCDGCSRVFGPLSFMLHTEQDYEKLGVTRTILWSECIQLVSNVETTLERAFWNTFVDWFQIFVTLQFADGLSSNASIVAQKRSIPDNSVSKSRVQTTSASTSVAPKLSDDNLNLIPASPAPYARPESPDVQEVSHTTPVLHSRGALPPTSQQVPVSLQQTMVQATQQQSAGRRVARQMTSIQARHSPMYPGQHYGAQQQKAAVLQQQQQRQASQPHPYGQLSRRNSGSSLQPSFTASQHQLAAAQQLSSHHPAGQGYMGSFRINPMRQQSPKTILLKALVTKVASVTSSSVTEAKKAENYQRSTASYLQPGSYAINSQQQQPSRTMQPPPQLGLNSPSSSTVSSVASETFTSALRQHQSSMVNMESAFRQLEEENASLKAQLAAEREEKQGYALKLQKAVAEIQTKEQQILAYTIELARYRVLPGHM